MDRQVSRGKITAEAKAEALARIRPTLKLTDLGQTDLVIEAATERETVKQAIFEDLLPHLLPHTILTSNTSSISITRLASRTDRPEKFMGFHFMNPVPVMQLVELIRGIATDEPTYNACLAVVERLGKTAASAEDFPAFIVNRILMPMINEAVYTLYEGVGSVKSIDESLKLGANHPMGPLELADFIGLDTCLAIMNVLHDGLADTKYRPCPLLVKYVEAGWLGRKTQRGFYDYRGEVPVPHARARGCGRGGRPSGRGFRPARSPGGIGWPMTGRWGRFSAWTTSCRRSPWRSVAEVTRRSGRGASSGPGKRTGRTVAPERWIILAVKGFHSASTAGRRACGPRRRRPRGRRRRAAPGEVRHRPAPHVEVLLERALLVREGHRDEEVARSQHAGEERAREDAVVGAHPADELGQHHPVDEPVGMVRDHDERPRWRGCARSPPRTSRAGCP
jgi:3-hydroxybutyryl-CoA dehydrogenase